MTLHKSKGLEFDLVFHLDLYRWILPQFNGDYAQDLNLHYVGITRAKEACILCNSTHRHNSNDQIVVAEDSEFLSLEGLPELRVDSPI
jgi:DNA helicase-2/ATP-dependent DNA helicase PcrA